MNNENSEENLISWLKFIKAPDSLNEKDLENVYIREAKRKLDELRNDEYEQEIAEFRMRVLQDKKSDGSNSKVKQKVDKNERVEIAKKMLKKGRPIEEIIEITELSEDEIKKLK